MSTDLKPYPLFGRVFFSESPSNLTPSVTGKKQPGAGGQQQPTGASATSAQRHSEPETRTPNTCPSIPDDADPSPENIRNTESIKKTLSRNQKRQFTKQILTIVFNKSSFVLTKEMQDL